ncbi:aspartic peptidase domain-containing protein [Scenedesmus sp. NREL 46B-D3]|nr:aspartic peptidase domain-containing protein [Scenedesmus sp. NREL 46B-D3]
MPGNVASAAAAPGPNHLHPAQLDLQLQSNGRYGLVVPLGVRHGVHRVQGRSLMRSGITPVLGAIREGYFYAQLGLGTPPRNFSTIIDTGSTITYVPCASCAHCGVHMVPGFDPEQSSSAQLSSSEGWLIQDKLRFPDNGSSIDFVFGCENKETGAIFKQQVDGVLGMGNNENSFPRQLARTGLVDDVFSLCYGFPAGGAMLLGDVPVEPAVQLQYTPLVDRQLHYYNVGLQSISLGKKSLGVSMGEYAKGYGTVLDSGTTFTYLPTAAFSAFLGLLTEALQHRGLHRSSGADPQFKDICWRGAPHDFKGLDKVFPTGTVSFAGGASFQLTPQRYLFRVGRGEYCLGVFDNGWQGTLLGGILVRNVLVQYDKKRQRVGFAEVDCNSIRSEPVATGHTAASQAAASQPPQTGGTAAEGAQDGAEGAPAPPAAADDGRPSVREAAAEQQQQQQWATEGQQLAEAQGSSHQQQRPSTTLSSWAAGSDGSGSAAQYWWLGFIAGGVLMALAVHVVHAVRQVATKSKGYMHMQGAEALAAAVATELTPLAAGLRSSDTVQNV